ncbi:MAG: DNA repair protein RecO C-terminal domain-containing protein [Planctomycetota bacterium]|nr:DNA repair protein RecO C-terminal domain-containing protein [Planctomycetota bacterium]
MPIVKDQAQILRVFDQGNTSQVLVLLGRTLGQMRVLAKGSRRFHKKGFEGGFDMLARGEILVYPRRDETLWIFKEWEERSRPEDLGASPERLAAASYLCELAEALTRETSGSSLNDDDAHRPVAHTSGDAVQAHADLYDLLAGAVDQLSALPPRATAGPVLLAFSLHALRVAGFTPGFSRCSHCGKSLVRSPDGEPSREMARLSHEGLACETCLAEEALNNMPVGMAPPATKRELARLAAQFHAPARHVWLAPESLNALDYVMRTGKGVTLSKNAAEALARALIVAVHGALERDLRTLRAAARAVYLMGPRPKALAR